MRIAVLITCHNRREKTLACLEALFANVLPKGFEFDVILVDDGSTDGTVTAVRLCFPEVEILRGDGNLFWNRGMCRALARALELGFDGYLWLNDDTVLYPTALHSLINTWQERKASTSGDAIYVGSTQDPQTGQLTYGGVVRHSRLRPFRFSLVKPGDQPRECQTMNGNCVFVPQCVVRRLGNLEPRFAHGLGDTDYGLRAAKVGIKIFVVPGYVGLCGWNDIAGTFTDLALPLRIRWKKMMQPKGLPPASWLLFTSRHGGLLWPALFVWPYIRQLLKK